MDTRANLNGKFNRNSAAEDTRIKAGVKADPDTRELKAADFAAMTPFPEAMRRRRGRPKATTHKVPVTVRLEPRVLAFFKSGGRGWQTRMNDTLVGYVDRQQRGTRVAR
jgi:uncharacterized protein (DUF4415 family)